MYFDSKTFLSGLLLVEDKLGMAHGLETRFPFLDNEIVDFGWNLSIDEKVKKNKVTGEMQGKEILRRVAAGLLSDEIAFRSKSGFSGPDAQWFKHELGAYMENFFIEENVIWEYLDKNESLKYYIEHVEGKKNRRLFLWSVLYLNSLIREIWGS
jgi:asparagine synthase (glutamine-hydrolysing)